MRQPVFTIALALLSMTVPPARAAVRTIDLTSIYLVVRTIDHTFDPALDPDMDGDGQLDLEGQPNLVQLIAVLADAHHPHHDDTLETFLHNEALALAAFSQRFPGEPFVPYMAEFCGVFMTVQGAGAYTGPTTTGMAGRVESIWNYLQVDSVAGPFGERSWSQAAVFASTAHASIAVTGGGIVFRGDRVVLAATPTTGITYTWYKDYSPLDSPSSASLILDPVDFDDAGEYICEITTPDKALLQTPPVLLVVNDIPQLPVAPAGPLAGLALALTLCAFGAIPAKRLR